MGAAELAHCSDFSVFGPFYAKFPLTLTEGKRVEVLGPVFYRDLQDSQKQWGVPILGMSWTEDPAVESGSFDLLYPAMTYTRYGEEYRWQFFELFSFAGGKKPDADGVHRFTLFPLYFQQRAADPKLNYTALLPIYGHLQNRLFRDRIDFVMLPLYVKSQKRDVMTWNMPYPFFHLREGNGLKGWQLWPFYGEEHKVLTQQTLGFDEVIDIGGHENHFVLWPFFTDSRFDLGTTNAGYQQGLIPFYSIYRAPQRDSTTWFWPFGVTHTIDREGKYDEWDAPWPLVEFAHGEGKTTKRIWPFFSNAKSKDLENDWYLWPIYKVNKITSPPLYRSRTRILFFLYSDTVERNTETEKEKRRTDFFPFYSREVDFNGKERFQALSILEPFFPTNQKIARDYSPLWALWRYESNPATGVDSQSLLWNLWRRESGPKMKNISLLFGLFQYQSNLEGRRWRVLYLPAGRAKQAAPAPRVK